MSADTHAPAFAKVGDADFVSGEHDILKFWNDAGAFEKLRAKNAGGPKWSFLDGPITANNPMGVHHAWGRTYKDAFQRFHAMRGEELRYQNGFDCQGLWVEVEVQKEFDLKTNEDIEKFGVDRFTEECKKRVLRFAARQTEQSVRLGYWMNWDFPEELRALADAVGSDKAVQYTAASGVKVSDKADAIVENLGSPRKKEWGGSYFTFSTENNETIWKFLKTCFDRKKVYRGHDVMPWSGKTGSAYSQMEVNDGRKLTTHRALFVRFPLLDEVPGVAYFKDGQGNRYADPERTKPLVPLSPPAGGEGRGEGATTASERKTAATNRRTSEKTADLHNPAETPSSAPHGAPSPPAGGEKEFTGEYLLVWTTTPWTLTANVAAAINPDLDYARVRNPKDGAIYYLAADNLDFKRVERQFKEGFDSFGDWPEGVPKLNTLRQLFKQNGGIEELERIKGQSLSGTRYSGPFDHFEANQIKIDSPGNASKRLLAFKERLRRIVEDTALDAKSRMSDLHRALDEAAGGAAAEQQQITGTWKEPSASPISTEIKSQLSDATAEIRRLFTNALKTAKDHARFSDSLRKAEAAFSKLCEVETYTNQIVGDGLIDGVQLRFQQHIDDLASHVNTFASDLLESFNARRSPAECHSAIPGGRDSRGKFTVLAGEGTGIVHTAPACGDVDHSLGLRIGLSFMPPLNEAGEFEPCFGEFTGRRAVDPETVDLVIQKLKEGGFYFAEEKYPHIYPHCWRTGDELVFRLVDEWFVDMDWRDEIKEVVDSITWLPASIQGKDRENEWLTNMRDWMISKKRFWGLALPIWANPDDPQEFYVVESLKELEDLAVEGWDVLEGHSPHKPYIDAVKIKHPESGNVLERIPDVGNPWLDAGITPFSTMGFNTDRDEWSEWFPADFVTECFPGQFRNWFYSLLALATMMRHEEATPELKRPFKTLLGHRLVMNEHGQAMHKSDGTAIWFEEAAEQLGVDTMRWMYLAQRPDQDLRFGLRNADEPVTLKTPDGAITETREGFPTCRVTSTPADETRRRVLIPLWNSYAFFTNYAILDGFDPAAEQVPVAERPEIDRWLLSRLQELAGDANEAWEAFDARAFCLSAEAFIDDLSNWYIRRNRKRFWKGASDGFDADKLAAYQTLHHVLVELSKLLAPAVPFLSERLYQNLVRTTDASAPESVHHCDYPAPNADLLDAGLTASTAVAQRVVRLGHQLREQAGHRVRQPLAELRFAADDKTSAAVDALSDVIADELNVKSLARAESLDDIVSYAFKPNLKTLGPKYGKLLGAIRKELPTLDAASLAPLRSGDEVTVTIGSEAVTLGPDDVLISVEQTEGWVAGDDADVRIALSTTLTDDLRAEGLARDLIRQVQQLRKEADLEENDRITVTVGGADDATTAAIDAWSDTIREETRADTICFGEAAGKEVAVGDAKVTVAIGS